MADLPQPSGIERAGTTARYSDYTVHGGVVYCVEVPSANQPPAMGAAPRIVLPRNCS